MSEPSFNSSKPLFGYWSRILHIDLANQSSSIEILPDSVYRLLLGGKGLGIYLLLRIPPKVDPFGGQNDFIFVAGPLVGTIAPCANKFGIVTKGPASGGFLDAYSSGRFSSQLKFAGFDAIVLHHIAPNPTVLKIENDQVEFLDAATENVIGKSPLETESLLRKKYGLDFACAAIGLAGEKRSFIAGVFTEQRCAARGGGGAVLGSKQVKAVLLKGTHALQLASIPEFRDAAWIARRYIRSGEITVRAMPQEGTINITDVVNERGGYPTRNFRSGSFDRTDKINGESWRTGYWSGVEANKPGKIRNGIVACSGCPIACSKISYSHENPSPTEFPERIQELQSNIVIDGPEYETNFALGPNVGNSDPEVVLQANYLCDFYGIDTISAGGIIACLMEMYEQHIITAADLDGISPTWGNKENILALLRKMGTMEGCGQILGRGVKAIAEKWPAGKKYALHVKGLELPGYEPRGSRGMALCYALSDRGACHLHAFTASYELLGQGGGADPMDLSEKKLEIFLNCQAESTLTDCAGLCFFTLNGVQSKEIRNMLKAATGLPEVTEPKYLDILTKRVLALTRFFNYREGLTMTDDFLPERFLTESQTDPPYRPPLHEFDQTLRIIYRKMGWDDLGAPTLNMLQELGLTELLPNFSPPK
jgi:aldehyde:ferredoxin oxidoreductase